MNFAQIRRVVGGFLRRPAAPADAELLKRVGEVERRLAHLESALEGLQDAVHRESVRRNEQTTELRHRTEPSEIARALTADARDRGL
jgi:uncharacterized coiled-coil protein SlyX